MGSNQPEDEQPQDLEEQTATPPPHPTELEALDLYDVWSKAEPLGETFDPFRFSHRMAAYRQLIHATNASEIFGADNAKNLLWGLMFQHQWQYRTRRLGNSPKDPNRIDPDAPWGYGNYALCVIPWLGALAAGVVPNLELVPPSSPSRFDYASGGGAEPLTIPDEFAAGIDDWKSFFEQVASSLPGTDQEPLRLALWKAHKTCLDVVAARIAGIDPAPYSALELTFLRGWCRMVDYLWVAAWPTDFAFMFQEGLDALPERLLADSDDLEALTDMPEKVARNVRNVVKLARTSALRYRFNLWLWKRTMHSRAARDEVVAMLDAVFNPNPDSAGDRKRMLGYLLKGRED